MDSKRSVLRCIRIVFRLGEAFGQGLLLEPGGQESLGGAVDADLLQGLVAIQELDPLHKFAGASSPLSFYADAVADVADLESRKRWSEHGQQKMECPGRLQGNLQYFTSQGHGVQQCPVCMQRAGRVLGAASLPTGREPEPTIWLTFSLAVASTVKVSPAMKRTVTRNEGPPSAGPGT